MSSVPSDERLYQLARCQVRLEALERCLASILYPECLAPVEFVDYRLVASNRPA